MAGNVSGPLAFGATALGAVLYGVYKQSQAQTQTPKAAAKGDAKDSKSAAAAGAGAGGATNQTAAASAGAAAAAAGGAAPLSAAQMAELKPLVEQWLLWDPNADDRAAVAKLWGTGDLAGRNGDAQALYRAFCPRISFGTAGLRARMAPGYAQMNDLVVTQTSQGLCRYAQREFPEGKAQAMGAVIGYDGRHKSKRFAEITAAVFLSQGFRVWLFRELAMTPIVPFSVLQYGAAVGVMVTASHNPKQDNGYKVYWANGAQIIQPRDAHISALIQQNLQPWADVKLELDLAHPNLFDPTKAMGDKYMTEIAKRYCWTRAANATSQLRIAYTAMHGVGHAWIRRAFAAFGLPPFIPTKEQVEPDPDFPTVEFPNPEEGKGALALAMRTADANGCPVILANDPDADRLAVAEKDLKTGEWRVLNGNQIGVLFADYVWQQYVAREKPTAEQKAKALMLASTVSSKMLKAMAKAEGFTFWGTLTGFKWMGNVAQHAITPAGGGYNFLFAYEVEIGFLVGDLSLDKDGVRTGAIFAELAGALYAKGSTLWEHLQTLYARYGYFQMTNSYYFCYSPATMDAIFARLRSMGPGGSYPNACGPYRIASVRDVTLGIDTGKAGGKAVVPTVPDAQMLTFRFENGGTCTLRGSGTEPKLKFYVECDSKISERTAQALLNDMTKYVVSEFLRPELNALVARKVA